MEFPGQGYDTTILSTAGAGANFGPIWPYTNPANAVWPSANRAIFTPVLADVACVVRQFAISVFTQSGNVDLGIYNEWGKRLASTGSVAVGAAGIQTFDITDLPIPPGVYFLAMACDNITASFQRIGGGIVAYYQSSGVQQQASAFPLPDPAVMVNPFTAYSPVIQATIMSGVI